MKIIINGEVVEIPGGSPAAPSNDALPIGAVIMWAGTAETIPEGFHICDGTDGTIDLRNRFVLGAGAKYTPGATGGVEEVTLTVEQMPSHEHSLSQQPITGASSTVKGYARGNDIGVLSSQMLRAVAVGGGQSHPNMPPYYALYFIQKIA